jgi:hypothetical protein
LQPVVLSTSIADSGTTMSHIIPWNIHGANTVTDKTTPMSKLKDPVSLDDYLIWRQFIDYQAGKEVDCSAIVEG